MLRPAKRESVSVLSLSLHERLVAYVAGFQSGRTVLSFVDEYRLNPARDTFSLITHPTFPNAEKIMATAWANRRRLHPVLSNLLPEGALRELIAQGLKTHIDNEFQILSYLGQDLPGALVATPVPPERVPESVLGRYASGHSLEGLDSLPVEKFSLAGVQMKFSMKEVDGRFNFGKGDELGDWIIKTPSTKHKQVPLNEFTAMSLAALAGVNIPDIKLVDTDSLDNLPAINLPDEKQAFAIRRFDRDDGARIHMEDFAQILVKYPHEKYGSTNYDQLAKVIYDYAAEGLADVQQFARRLLVNILLGNGDAHLKNWSMFYPDRLNPRLSPAYDIVTTRAYMDSESHFALNLGKTKEWYGVRHEHFERWAGRAGVPWRAIKPHLDDTLDKARRLWPEALKDLPMHEKHKEQLIAHWRLLQKDFRI